VVSPEFKHHSEGRKKRKTERKGGTERGREGGRERKEGKEEGRKERNRLIHFPLPLNSKGTGKS
jgi:hypothetical protein